MRDVVITEVEYSGPPRRSRNLEERLMVRFPALFRRLVAFAHRRLPNPRSRLRRALLRRANISGWAAFSRRDFKLRRAFFASDVESELPPGPQTLGLSGTFHGYEAMERAMDEWADSWGASELVPAYIIDLGDRLLLLGFFRARGQASGVQLEQEYAQLLTLRDGLATRDQGWFQWEEGLHGAGSTRMPSPSPSEGGRGK